MRDRLVPLERQVRFEAGDWVDLPFGPNLAGWRVRAGDWVCEDDDTVVGTVRHDQGMTLVCGTPIGSRWELRGAMDLSELPDDPFYYAGLLVHYHDEMRMTWYQGIGLTPASGRIGVMDRFTRETRVESTDAYPMKERFTFDLTVWDDHIAMSISGGEPFVTQLPSTWRTQQGPYFAIGTNVWRIPSHMRYSSLRVHRLDTCPDAIQRAIDAAP